MSANAAVPIHHVVHGDGFLVLVLHGAGVDHRETEACFEPALAGDGTRRIYLDLPGIGRSPAEGLGSAEDVLETLRRFADEVTAGARYAVVGHSAGGYFARALAERSPDRVAGLALVCPLLAEVRDVPEHRVVEGPGDLGDDEFRGYFVVQTPEMLERYERYVVPSAELVDAAALERIGGQWELAPAAAYTGPTLVVAGRLDSTVGYAAAVDLAADLTHSTLAVIDGTGHALPHEKPDLLRALVAEWLASARNGA